MNILDEIEAKGKAALAALEGFNQAFPDIAGVEADALKTAVADIGSAVDGLAAKVVPPSLDSVFDGLIADAEAAADAQIESITAAKNAKIESLQAAKAAAATPPA